MVHLLFELLKPEVLFLWLLTGFIIAILSVFLFKASEAVYKIIFDWSDIFALIAITIGGPISLFQLLILIMSSYFSLERKRLFSITIRKRNPYKDRSQPYKENKKSKP